MLSMGSLPFYLTSQCRCQDKGLRLSRDDDCDVTKIRPVEGIPTQIQVHRSRKFEPDNQEKEPLTKMIFMTFLAMAVHEIKNIKTSFEPLNGPEDDPFVRWVDVDPGQAPPNIPYLLDDLIPPPPHPNNFHNDVESHGPSIAYCPPVWMYRTEYYASEADKYEKNFGKKFPAGKPYVLT